MVSIDNSNRIAPQLVLAPINKTATFNSSAVDSANLQALTFLVAYGATGDTLSGSVYVACKVQKSTTSNFVAAVDLGATDLIRAEGSSLANAFATVDDNTEDDAVYTVGVKLDPDYRYYRVVATFTGSHTYGVEMAIIALRLLDVNPNATALVDTP